MLRNIIKASSGQIEFIEEGKPHKIQKQGSVPIPLADRMNWAALPQLRRLESEMLQGAPWHQDPNASLRIGLKITCEKA